MSVIGQGTIELSADSRKLRAGIDSAKRSINELGIANQNATKQSSASIDKYVRSLGVAALVTGKSAREAELLKLGLRGATDAQLKAADAALRMSEAHARGVAIGQQLRTVLLGIGLAAGTGLIAAAVAFDRLINQAGKFQDLAEKMSDSGEAVASFAIAAKIGGIEMDEVAGLAVKLSKNLSGVDDESVAAGAAIKALGLDLDKFKQLSNSDRLEAFAKALFSFKTSAEQGDVAVAALGKSGAQALPFLKELATGVGRQNILTAEQIRLADEYSDKQAKVRAQISLHAQAIASQFLPAYSDLSNALLRVIKDIAGVGEASDNLKNNNSIAAFADSAADSLGVLVNAADLVARAFDLVGSSIAARALQAKSILSGDFHAAISTEVELIKKYKDVLSRPLFSERLTEVRGARKSIEANAAQNARELNRSGVTRALPDLRFDGAVKNQKSGIDTAAQEAKARLAQDLADIIASSRVLENTFQNSEKILEAKRAAALVEEADYYQKKRELLDLTSVSQENALQEQIARLQKEILAGRNVIENETKIIELRRKLAETRENAGTGLEVLSIQEGAAAAKLKQYYVDAQAAAQSYLDTLTKAQDIEIAGLGIGDQERSRLAARLQIEEKYNAQRQQLVRDRRNAEANNPEGLGPAAKKRFDDELALIDSFQSQALSKYDSYYQKLLQGQLDWTNGASRALQNYYDESRNVAKLTEEAFTGGFRKLEDALLEFTKTGKLNFKSLADYALTEINRMAIKSILGDAANELKSGSGIIGSIGKLFGLDKQSPAPVEERSITAALGVGADAAGAASANAGMVALAASTLTANTGLIALSASTIASDAGLIGLGVTTTVADTGLISLAVAAEVAAAALLSMGASSSVGAAAGLVGAFATGSDYVPRTGLALVHEGERIIPAAQNMSGDWGGRPLIVTNHFTINGPTTRATESQIAAKAGQSVQRAMARNT
jgi:lambda family phage tail tape measure protein